MSRSGVGPTRLSIPMMDALEAMHAGVVFYEMWYGLSFVLPAEYSSDRPVLTQIQTMKALERRGYVSRHTRRDEEERFPSVVPKDARAYYEVTAKAP
jgi:hypothetical protein